MNEIEKFTKECRALRLKGATEEQWEYAEKLGQACIYIDQQAKHIELLQQCDDSATEVIAKMDGEIDQLQAKLDAKKG